MNTDLVDLSKLKATVQAQDRAHRAELTSAAQFFLGTRIEKNGAHYLVTKEGPKRLEGNRKARRAQEAGLRKAGAV